MTQTKSQIPSTIGKYHHLGKIIKWDFNLQLKYGIIPIYGVITTVYVLLLWFLPIESPEPMMIMLIFTDPVLLGILFIAVLVYFEKSENVFQALNCTPLSPKDYIISKGLTLSTISTFTSFLIFILPYGLENGIDGKIVLFLLSVFISSLGMVFLGFAYASRLNNFNEYMMMILVVVLVFMVPLLDFFGLAESAFFYIIPSQASLILIQSAFVATSTGEIVFSIIYLIIFVVVSFKLAEFAFHKYLIIGGKSNDE